MGPKGFAFVAFVAFVAFGCSSTLIDATVTNASQPASGVEVSMDCPQAIKAGGPSLFGKTDANGRLEFREPSGSRWIHDGCDIIVGSRRFPVKAVCVEYRANHCVHVVVTTDLAGDARRPSNWARTSSSRVDSSTALARRRGITLR